MHVLLFCSSTIIFGCCVNLSLTYNGRNCGFCDNLETARYFLMKLNKWRDGKVEIMHIFFILLIRPKLWLLWQLEVSIGL